MIEVLKAMLCATYYRESNVDSRFDWDEINKPPETTWHNRYSCCRLLRMTIQLPGKVDIN